jgi:hypothetical protein
LKKLGHKEDRLHTDGLHVMLRLYIESYTLTVQFKILKQDASNTLVLSSLIPSFKGSSDKSVSPFATVRNKPKRHLKSLLLLSKSGFNITVV